MSFSAIGLLAISLAFWDQPPLPGRLHYGRCGMNAHTEAYPHARLARRAYGCRSDSDGFLESRGQGDRRGN